MGRLGEKEIPLSGKDLQIQRVELLYRIPTIFSPLFKDGEIATWVLAWISGQTANLEFRPRHAIKDANNCMCSPWRSASLVAHVQKSSMNKQRLVVTAALFHVPMASLDPPPPQICLSNLEIHLVIFSLLQKA